MEYCGGCGVDESGQTEVEWGENQNKLFLYTFTVKECFANLYATQIYKSFPSRMRNSLGHVKATYYFHNCSVYIAILGLIDQKTG